MTRLTPAAMQLIVQVQKINPKFKATITGEPDGFGRYRAVEFDAASSKVIVPILEVLNDKRIASVDYEGKGRAVVTFVSDTRADSRTEYPLETVNLILTEQKASEEQEAQ